ncbi:hypothetical protein KSB_92680 [Ktedonobacter robiniae]|uniref:Uncharacterized protein n=2 Tax=Ktedonobacter robiniae TaxID=2778365 RepID=A0ABQ3V754_9CHLR|nr:hypothetical protein KSB_92680 [Ktedonobacter robiniae]
MGGGDMKKEIRFLLPEHTAQVQALGFACGLTAGMAMPHYPPDTLPPIAPIQALSPIATNDPALFRRLFREGHEPGLFFGRQASQELAHVLAPLPEGLWFPICMYFAEEHMQIPKEEKQTALIDLRIQQGVKAFHTIYHKHLA